MSKTENRGGMFKRNCKNVPHLIPAFITQKICKNVLARMFGETIEGGDGTFKYEKKFFVLPPLSLVFAENRFHL